MSPDSSRVPDPVPRGARLLCLVLVAGVVAATCLTILGMPQLEPDDFRYLSLVQDLRAGEGAGFPQAFVVENRWDHLWFTDTDAVVRFFRPTVVLSFWLDELIWGRGPTGPLVTTLVLHAACCLLAMLFFLRFLGRVVPALAAGLLFAAFAAHAETIWYASGRTDTLAALGFLGGLVLHVHADDRRPWLRYLALPAFAFAIVSKELAAALPVIVLLHDRWVLRRESSLLRLLRRDWPLYAGYAAIALLFAIVRQSILGGATGTDLVWPYFVSPLSDRFPEHLLVQLRTYAGNLFAGEVTPPFMSREQFTQFGKPLGWVLTFLAPAAALVLLKRERRFWVLALLALLTWLPTCFVYVSERYLYLPSVAVAGMAGLALLKLRGRPGVAAIGLVVALAWTGHQAWALHFRNWYISHMPREAFALGLELNELPFRMPRGARILFVNLPSETLHAQFLEHQLRVFFADPALQVRTLSLSPPSSGPDAGPTVERVGTRSLRISTKDNLMAKRTLFPWRSFQPDAVVDRPRVGFRVRVLDGDGERCRAFRVDLPQPVSSYVILRFVPAGPHDVRRPPGFRILEGKFERIRP